MEFKVEYVSVEVKMSDLCITPKSDAPLGMSFLPVVPLWYSQGIPRDIPDNLGHCGVHL